MALRMVCKAENEPAYARSIAREGERDDLKICLVVVVSFFVSCFSVVDKSVLVSKSLSV